jgi:hypothetical protein
MAGQGMHKAAISVEGGGYIPPNKNCARLSKYCACQFFLKILQKCRKMLHNATQHTAK